MRHVLDPGRGGRAEGGATGARVGHLDRGEHRRRAVGQLVEKARQMAREVVHRAARRHHVDEAKERRTDLEVGGGELHRARIERLHRVPRRRRERIGELGSDAVDLRLDLLTRGAHGRTVAP